MSLWLVIFLLHTHLHIELDPWISAKKTKVNPAWRDYHLFRYSLFKPQTPSKDMCPSLWTPKGWLIAWLRQCSKPNHTTSISLLRKEHTQTSASCPPVFSAHNIKIDNKSGLCSPKKKRKRKNEGRQSKRKCPGIKRLAVMNNKSVCLELQSGNDNEINNELITMHVTERWYDLSVQWGAWSLLLLRA